MMEDGGDSGEVLRLLGLERVTAAPELLRMMSARFRPPQQAQLLAALRALGEDGSDSASDDEDEDEDTPSRGPTRGGGPALAQLAAHFDRKLDVRGELERFLLDLLRLLGFVASKGAHSAATRLAAARDPRVRLFAGLGDRQDRERLAKVFQALGGPASAAYCRVASTLPPKYLQELLRRFADDLPELQTWMNWLGALRTSASPETGKRQPRLQPADLAAEFLGRCVREQCLSSWLALLRPLDAPSRLAVVAAADALPASSSSLLAHSAPAVGATASPLKKLGRFLETTAVSPLTLLALDASVRRALPLLLDEIPTVPLQLVLAKFGANAVLMELLTQRGLALLGKPALLRLLEALAAPAVTPSAAQAFVAALFASERLHALLTLFFRLEPASQWSVIQLTARVDATSAAGAQGSASPTAQLFGLLLASSHGRAIDGILRNLADLPPEMVVRLLAATTGQEEADGSPAGGLAVLAECLELATDPGALASALSVFLLLGHQARVLLAAWLRDEPDAAALPVYRVLESLLRRHQHGPDSAHSGQSEAQRVLDTLAGLHARDKALLCREVLRGDVSVDGPLLLFLTDTRDVDGSQRRKMLRLLRLIPRDDHAAFLLLLSTQPAAQQEALVRLMRSLPADANRRLLRQVGALPSDTVDALFELLLLIPKAECAALAKLLASANVSTTQLDTLVTVAADMKNQAASRELVMFAADLPPDSRAVFFDMLADKVPEKGVLLRMMSLSSRVAPPLLCRLVRLLHRMASWDVRSAFVEQLRSLELESELDAAVAVLSEQELDALRWAVTLLTPFPAQIRVAFARVMLQLGPTTERRGVLAMLAEIPKNRVGEFMTAVCDSDCTPVSASFLLVASRLEPQFHFPLLPLLRQDEWWFFVDLMAAAAGEATSSSGEDPPQPVGTRQDTVNAVASVLVRLVGDSSHLSLFRSVVQHALACSVPLDALVSVITAFIESTERLLALLRYVLALGARGQDTGACVPLLFRVLAQCSQPALVFSICRIADVDDAMFALLRLDRRLTWDAQGRAEVVHALERLAAQANAAGGVDANIVDGFFNFVRRFRELEPKLDERRASDEERTVTARASNELSRSASSSAPRVHSCREYHAAELSPDELSTLEAAEHLASEARAAPQTSPPSCRRVALERHIRRTLTEGERFPRKRSTHANWWEELEQVALFATPRELLRLETSPKKHDEKPQLKVDPRGSGPARSPNRQDEATRRPKREQLRGTSDLADGPSVSDWSHDQSRSARATVAILETRERRADDPLGSATSDDRDERQLSRAESAPETLELQRWTGERQRAKHMRGLCAGLEREPEFHVERDRAARMLRRECQDAYALSPARIRVAKTPVAQARVFQARVRRALGQRRLPAVDAARCSSALVRPDRSTMERAACALAQSERHRVLAHSQSATEALASGTTLHERAALAPPVGTRSPRHMAAPR